MNNVYIDNSLIKHSKSLPSLQTHLKTKMASRDVSYEDELIEFLQELFPDRHILSAVMRATIEGGKLVLPEVYVYFEEAPGRAEQRISSHIDSFITRRAAREGASYEKTLRRIIVDDIHSLQDLSGRATDNWY